MANKGYLLDKDGNYNYLEEYTEGWHSLSQYYNNVQDYGAGYRIGRYRKRNDEIIIEATLKFTSTNSLIMTLPAGMRPLQHMNFVVAMNGGGGTTARLAKIEVRSDGKVQLQDTAPKTNDWISLTGVRFFTD